MKKKLSKNYIAFTLTEMTMVLLIMSVIAAVSAPLVKHAVSDVTNNSVGIPTKLWGKVNGLAGIHNLNGDAGIVSIGAIPSGDPINYNNPALMIQANGKDNISNIAQIGFYATNWFDQKDNSRWNAPGLDHTKLAMDKYNNIAFTRNSYEDVKETFDSIELGNIISTSFQDYAMNGSHIHIGFNIPRTRINERTIGIYHIYYPKLDSDIRIVCNKTSSYLYRDVAKNVVISTSGSSGTYGVTSINSTIPNFINSPYSIGHNIHGKTVPKDNELAVLRYNTRIGDNYMAEWFANGRNEGNVSIGNYANSVIDFTTSPFKWKDRLCSVSIGKYAGSYTDGGGSNDGIVAIGLSALSMNNIPGDYIHSYSWGMAQNSVAIGSFTNAYPSYAHMEGRTEANSFHKIYSSVSIGSFAGTYSSYSNVSIGEYAGNSLRRPYMDIQRNSIFIGSFAGYGSKSTGQVAIGNYAGYVGVDGMTMERSNSIFIGHYAGYKASSDITVGIGKYACANSRAVGAVCIGQFPKEYIDARDLTTHTNYISDLEMLLYSHSGGRIFLVAKNIYAPGAINQISSDVRLKRKISLAPYSIKDFRKFDIYNFSLKYDKDHLKHIGVMAQEYRKAFPLAIVKGGKYLSIQPDWLYYSMINAVKDLDKLVQEFQVKLDEYVNNFESIKSRISTLEQSVAKEKQNNANMRKELEQINAQLLAKTKNNNKL